MPNGGKLDANRLLTDEDVSAIVTELKTQLVKDFQIEVGKGVLGWVKRAAILLLILAAVYGFAKTGWLPKMTPPDQKPVLPAAVGKVAMRAVGVVPKGFTVMPPHDTPGDILAMATELDRLNGGEA